MRKTLSFGALRRYAVVVIAVCGISVSAMPGVSGAAPGTGSGHAGSVSAAPGAVPGLWVVKTSGETVLEAVQRQSKTDPAYRAQARRTVAAWIARDRAGLPVTLLDGDDRPTTATAAALRDLGSTLDRPSPAGAPVPGTAASGRSGATVTVPATVRPMIDGNDPNHFPVKGAPGSGRSFWQNMPLTVSGAFCTGSCSITDKYTSRVTITPGPTSARVTATNLYSPNAGHFGNQHFELWGICRGTVCGDVDTGQLGGSSSNYVGYPDRHSNVITVAVTLWVYFTPTGNYVPDGAKTSDCTFPATGSICRF